MGPFLTMIRAADKGRIKFLCDSGECLRWVSFLNIIRGAGLKPFGRQLPPCKQLASCGLAHCCNRALSFPLCLFATGKHLRLYLSVEGELLLSFMSKIVDQRSVSYVAGPTLLGNIIATAQTKLFYC